MSRALFVATVPSTLRGFIIPFVEHFRSKGWVIDGMAARISSCSSCTSAFNRVWNVDWSRNPFDVKNLLKAPRTIRKAVLTGEYDLIHVHTPIASFVTRFALRNLKCNARPRIIYTAHGFHFYKGGSLVTNWFYLVLEKAAGKWTDYLVVINKEDLESAIRHRILPAERVTYMPGIGVDTSYYDPSRIKNIEVEKVRHELGLNAADLLFLMVAEFTANKRHEDVLRAFAKLNRPRMHVAFAGTGPLTKRILQLADELDVAERIHVLGFRKDVPILLKASVAIILPSMREGLPRSIMEALCMGVPCIGSKVRGTSDFLEGGRGMLFDVGDIDGLCAAMVEILERPAHAIDMVARGRALMTEYDIQNIIRMHEILYRHALAN